MIRSSLLMMVAGGLIFICGVNYGRKRGGGPGTAPEPSTFILLGSGLAAMLFSMVGRSARS